MNNNTLQWASLLTLAHCKTPSLGNSNTTCETNESQISKSYILNTNKVILNKKN